MIFFVDLFLWLNFLKTRQQSSTDFCSTKSSKPQTWVAADKKILSFCFGFVYFTVLFLMPFAFCTGIIFAQRFDLPSEVQRGSYACRVTPLMYIHRVARDSESRMKMTRGGKMATAAPRGRTARRKPCSAPLLLA